GRLLEGVEVLEAPPTDPEVSALGYDSRRLNPGACFVAIPGTHTDGHRYVETALRDGAVAAVVQRRAGAAWPQVVVPDTRRALALMSSTFYGRPSADMVVIGVTGTDGKTTTTTMIHQMLLSAGRRVGSMSTVDIRLGDAVDPNDSRQTTLEALEVQEQLARMRDAGIKYAVIETSSHGLALQRVVGVEYDVAVFTNIAHEHLDFHKTTEAYREAKAQLIDLTAGSARKGIEKTAVLNRDDPSYAYLVDRPIARRITYGLQLEADLKADRVEATPQGLRVDGSTPLGPLALDLKLSGRWIAARLSDYAVFTNEDPREEDAMTILSEIAAGAEEVGWTEGHQYTRIEDRRQGIAHAVRRAGPGDTILLAGKGHERSILIGRG